MKLKDFIKYLQKYGNPEMDVTLNLLSLTEDDTGNLIYKDNKLNLVLERNFGEVPIPYNTIEFDYENNVMFINFYDDEI